MNATLTTFLDGKHSFYMYNESSATINSTRFIFEESDCPEIYKTFTKVLNCTDCPNWTPKMVKKMPEFKFNLANTNGGYLHLELFDMIVDFGPKCAVNYRFIQSNDTALPFSDAAIYGVQYFQRYSSLQIDYDNMKIAFSGSHDPSHFEKYKSGNGGTIALIIILIVVGAGLIGTSIWWY